MKIIFIRFNFFVAFFISLFSNTKAVSLHYQLKYLNYLLTARHRKGYGIHSPLLFELITQVVESRIPHPEYAYLSSLNKLLRRSFTHPKAKKLFNDDLSKKHGHLAFRLVRYLQPRVLFTLGPTSGMNIAYTAYACPDATHVYCSTLPEQEDRVVTTISAAIPEANIMAHNSTVLGKYSPGMGIISLTDNAEQNRASYTKLISLLTGDFIVLIKGIHRTRENESFWKEIKDSHTIKVSFDLFYTGLLINFAPLQKQDFTVYF